MSFSIYIPNAPSKDKKDSEKDKKDDEKKEKPAPAGSWLQHVDKDKKNNGILW